jgi:hypothetical protein
VDKLFLLLVSARLPHRNPAGIRAYRSPRPASRKTMRLLRRHDSGEFSLTQFSDEAVPPYAILSHRWGTNDEEVTFEDMTNGTGQDKAGYKKIRLCGAQASQDDLQYFWVDTCCIDKTNYAELSRAINSMFRWYRNAARCYVYLSDVSRLPSNNEKGYDPSPWESGF